jgi:hypothetical protein
LKHLTPGAHSLIHKAVSDGCPLVTKDVLLNTKHRNKAIENSLVMYGPANPNHSDDSYWKKVAKLWEVDATHAKSMRCGNCKAFDISPKMRKCIGSLAAKGSETMSGRRVIIGYCKLHDFKCASTRTCLTWVDGGPWTK